MPSFDSFFSSLFISLLKIGKSKIVVMSTCVIDECFENMSTEETNPTKVRKKHNNTIFTGLFLVLRVNISSNIYFSPLFSNNINYNNYNDC